MSLCRTWFPRQDLPKLGHREWLPSRDGRCPVIQSFDQPLVRSPARRARSQRHPRCTAVAQRSRSSPRASRRCRRRRGRWRRTISTSRPARCRTALRRSRRPREPADAVASDSVPEGAEADPQLAMPLALKGTSTKTWRIASIRDGVAHRRLPPRFRPRRRVRRRRLRVDRGARHAIGRAHHRQRIPTVGERTGLPAHRPCFRNSAA